MTHTLDIKALKACQAWDNYCNALHLARSRRYQIDAKRYHRIAVESLDQYFDQLEQQVRRANERGSV